MRKNATFTVAAAMIGLVMVFWVKSAVVASSADVRPRGVASLYFDPSAAYLPFRVDQPVW